MPATRQQTRRRVRRSPPPPPLDPVLVRGHRDVRALAWGIVATVLFHVLLALVLPRAQFFEDYPEPLSQAEALGRELPILLGEEPGESPPPKPPPSYVETNPLAPENKPDDTENFSARDQQAANETAPVELSPDKTPAREGEEGEYVTKVFSGSLETPLPSAPSLPGHATDAPLLPRVVPEIQAPRSGPEDTIAAEDPDGIASQHRADADPDLPEGEPASEGQATKQPEALVLVVPRAASEDRPEPAPRPRLPRALPGPVKRQAAGVAQTGRTAVNANFGPYGDYLERLQEAVQLRWDALCRQRPIRETQSRVVLEFVLTREGRIRDMDTVDTTSQVLGTLLCRAALEQGQPYGEWSAEMLALLGDDERITFTFLYQ